VVHGGAAERAGVVILSRPSSLSPPHHHPGEATATATTTSLRERLITSRDVACCHSTSECFTPPPVVSSMARKSSLLLGQQQSVTETSATTPSRLSEWICGTPRWTRIFGVVLGRERKTKPHIEDEGHNRRSTCAQARTMSNGVGTMRSRKRSDGRRGIHRLEFLASSSLTVLEPRGRLQALATLSAPSQRTRRRASDTQRHTPGAYNGLRTLQSGGCAHKLGQEKGGCWTTPGRHRYQRL
jgi:hypothetical protein